ncbi:hypothetical protein ONS95_000301 [Cadophora gregata]|uniref:uncharacterized protein n=1 Tax=Cadophora gregata TaxID=51156 RepID=UPI0026DBADD3|nr:uncharacterized protein ONS95_000301 [Cadophora gregata]KAK0125695.1 hypothetical protein ONS96_009528 [Cadophora gregata f. sp. sojae]KAK0128326.1 hypothetical protein ONS95_000301 [Cadophora gregata]
MAPSPLDGTPLAGLEHKIGMLIFQDEDLNITIHKGPFGVTIPDRITCAVGLEAINSTSGKRLLVKEAVKKGELICSSKPLLNIIDDDNTLKYTCDNCMVTQINEMSSRHRTTSTTLPELIADENIKFLACGSCKILYYCSKKCQKEAWKDHHKFECGTFTKMQKVGAGEALGKKKTRFLIRLLECRERGRLSESEWTEVLRLPTGRKSKMAMKPFDDVAVAVAEIVKAFVETNVSADKIVDLFCMMHNNQCAISIPLIKGCRMHDPTVPTECMVGTSLEPFLAYISHECMPSARIVHESAELRIRASRDIAAGEEVTLCYTPEIRDYQARKSNLKTFGEIDCNCVLCQKGDFGPQGPLRDQVRALKDIDLATSPNRIGDVKLGIQAMLDAGFGWGADPMRELHQQLLRGYFAKMNAVECLKIALKMRYQIEPAQYPPTSMQSRIETLYVLQSFLNFPAPGASKLGDLPMKVKELAAQVNFNLRDMLARDVAQCFGSDSMVANFEKDFAERQGIEFNKHVQRSSKRKLYKYVPLGQSEAARVKFVKNMNELLEWAGLDALEAKDLL